MFRLTLFAGAVSERYSDKRYKATQQTQQTQWAQRTKNFSNPYVFFIFKNSPDVKAGFISGLISDNDNRGSG